jgi:hypothetical protein
VIKHGSHIVIEAKLLVIATSLLALAVLGGGGWW